MEEEKKDNVFKSWSNQGLVGSALDVLVIDFKVSL